MDICPAIPFMQSQKPKINSIAQRGRRDSTGLRPQSYDHLIVLASHWKTTRLTREIICWFYWPLPNSHNNTRDLPSFYTSHATTVDLHNVSPHATLNPLINSQSQQNSKASLSGTNSPGQHKSLLYSQMPNGSRPPEPSPPDWGWGSISSGDCLPPWDEGGAGHRFGDFSGESPVPLNQFKNPSRMFRLDIVLLIMPLAEQLSPVTAETSWPGRRTVPGKVLKSDGEDNCEFDKSSKLKGDVRSKGWLLLPKKNHWINPFNDGLLLGKYLSSVLKVGICDPPSVQMSLVNSCDPLPSPNSSCASEFDASLSGSEANRSAAVEKVILAKRLAMRKRNCMAEDEHRRAERVVN